MPAYIDSFLGKKVQHFLHKKGIATSRTTPYSPCANGQVKRYNDIIWKSVLLTLKSKNLSEQFWQKLLTA